MIPEQNKLNMGCGFNRLDGYWNVDVEPKCNPDEVVDLETTPWPYEDNFFEAIHASNILEHLGQTPKQFTNVMKEMYRVSIHGAVWNIQVPHHRCDLYWDDYTHVRVLTPKTFKMFDQQFNLQTIERKLSESTFGLYHGVDVEITDVQYNITGYWRQQLQSGLIGSAQLDINLNTLANVAESVNITLKVHKPGRATQIRKEMGI
jgi:predicted SAM-dependent methyltransferase